MARAHAAAREAASQSRQPGGKGEFAQAARFFEEARQLAASTGETGMMKLASCSLGMASANLRLEEHMQGVVAAATKK